MKLLFTLITFLFSSIIVISQTTEDRQFIRKYTNTEKLEELKSKYNAHYQIHIDNSNVPQTLLIETINDTIIAYLSGFTPSGDPVYDYDENVNSAVTCGVDQIWQGGGTGLNLSGNNIVIGHWEAGGLALLNHQELDGKITHLENQPISSHATHTACTMLGTGIDPDARGFASNASIQSRRSPNDEAEMADFALNGGILSNHSYSTGDPNGTIHEYGLYNSNAREWDEVFYNAPYLFASKSAGNNRNDGVNTADNGYDIIYTTAGSKNVMTVGAVVDVLDYTGPGSVTQSVFSNWGPTDDWRIKPDITANGVTLYSASNGSITDYDYKSGTSMSAPSVTGAVALLQEHYHNLNAVYMKAATVKSLLINTANEVGDNDGPDFQSGWGLLNAQKAAEVISNEGVSTMIKEATLNENDTYSKLVYLESGADVRISIAWTDPAGTIVGGLDNSTPILVNDLDIRLIKGSDTYYPWMFEPNATVDNFTDPAVKGDNYRDNVERIDVSNAPEGNYFIIISHKGSLQNGNQDFSLVVNGMEATLDIGETIIDQIKIFPNPAKENLNIQIPEELTHNSNTIQILDSYGRVVKSFAIQHSNYNLSISDIASGMYVLRINTESHIFYKKFIIQ